MKNDIKTLRESMVIIEKLCLSSCEIPRKVKALEEIIEDIYCVAHLHSNCVNNHLDWHKKRSKYISW